MDKYLRRQLFVMTTIWLQGINCGIILAYPAILIDGTSADIRITQDQATWLGAGAGLSGILGFIILPLVFQTFGRKLSHIFCILLQLSSWLIFYFANNLLWLFIGRFVHGVTFGMTYLNGLIISEYSSPGTRGYYIAILKVFMTLGSLICRCLSFWTWKEPAIAGMFISAVGLIFNIFWVQSPAYCAYKGRFEDCKRNFIYLNGYSTKKKKELRQLISAKMDLLKGRHGISNFTDVLITCRDKSFLKALLLASLITLLVDSSGRFFVIAYVIQIMIELVGKSTAMYYSIAVDATILLAFCLSCLILKYLKRRTILFVFGSICSFLMLVICLVLYLKSSLNFAADAIWLTPTILIVQNFLVNLTVIPLCYTLLGEIFPLEHRGFGAATAGMVFSLFYLINIKCAPIMTRDLGLGGTYGIFGLCMFGSLFVLYFVLPETKSKTLQEIEDEMKDVKRNSYDLNEALEDIVF